MRYHLSKASLKIIIHSASKAPDLLWWLVKYAFSDITIQNISLKFKWWYWIPSQWLPCTALSFVKSIINNHDFESIENSRHTLMTHQMYIFHLLLCVNICTKFKVLYKSMLILKPLSLPSMYRTIICLKYHQQLWFWKHRKLQTHWWLFKCIYSFGTIINICWKFKVLDQSMLMLKPLSLPSMYRTIFC